MPTYILLSTIVMHYNHCCTYKYVDFAADDIVGPFGL